MSDEFVTPQDVGTEMLKQLYDAAYIETAIDADGDLCVKTVASCYVAPTSGGDRITLLAFLGTREDADRQSLLEFANRVNNQISSVRARLNANGSLIVDYHIPVEGGTTKKAIVLATRFFLDAAIQAIKRCDNDNVVR